MRTPLEELLYEVMADPLSPRINEFRSWHNDFARELGAGTLEHNDTVTRVRVKGNKVITEYRYACVTPHQDHTDYDLNWKVGGSVLPVRLFLDWDPMRAVRRYRIERDLARARASLERLQAELLEAEANMAHCLQEFLDFLEEPMLTIQPLEVPSSLDELTKHIDAVKADMYRVIGIDKGYDHS